MARRARIVLAAAGMENKAICLEVGADANTVGKWRRRFAAHRLDRLLDEPRPGTPRQIGGDEIAETIRLTLETTPPGATHWSLRSMAKAVGFAPSTIHRIWRAFGLQPHRSETFKLSTDPLFVEKVRDIIGLYMAPPERALVLCVDEKSQIQALDRSQPLLPMRPGQIEAAVPGDLDVHLVMDNYATHKTKPIRDWLAKRPRWHVHFTPTGASWIDEVERFFASVTEKQIRRGVHRSTQNLESDIHAFIDAHNADPKPFRWTKSADDILAAVQRFCQRSIQIGVITESGLALSATRRGASGRGRRGGICWLRGTRRFWSDLDRCGRGSARRRCRDRLRRRRGCGTARRRRGYGTAHCRRGCGTAWRRRGYGTVRHGDGGCLRRHRSTGGWHSRANVSRSDRGAVRRGSIIGHRGLRSFGRRCRRGRGGRRRRDLHGVIRHNSSLLRAGNHQDVLTDWKRHLACLGDGYQRSAGLLDDVFPALCICDRLLGRRTADAADQGPPDRADRSYFRAARQLCPSDAAGSATGGRTDRAIGAYQHRPHPYNHPTLHRCRLLCGAGGIGVWGVALGAAGEG